jgi:hypothetical protein
MHVSFKAVARTLNATHMQFQILYTILWCFGNPIRRVTQSMRLPCGMTRGSTTAFLSPPPTTFRRTTTSLLAIAEYLNCSSVNSRTESLDLTASRSSYQHAIVSTRRKDMILDGAFFVDMSRSLARHTAFPDSNLVSRKSHAKSFCFNHTTRTCKPPPSTSASAHFGFLHHSYSVLTLSHLLECRHGVLESPFQDWEKSARESIQAHEPLALDILDVGKAQSRWRHDRLVIPFWNLRKRLVWNEREEG